MKGVRKITVNVENFESLLLSLASTEKALEKLPKLSPGNVLQTELLPAVKEAVRNLRKIEADWNAESA